MLEKCPKCEGDAVQKGHMLVVVCSECGHRGEDFAGRLGEFQREHAYAGYSWNAAARAARSNDHQMTSKLAEAGREGP